MKHTKLFGLGVLASILASLVCFAADVPAPQEGDWVIRDFRFNTGETLPELHLHYRTLGSPKGEPVLILHGTTQSGAAMRGRLSAASYLVPGNHSTPRTTTSSCRTPSATVARASRPTACARVSRGITTTT